MRLLTDENIPGRLKELIPAWTITPVTSVKENSRLTDYGLWQFARTNRYAILTIDEEFTEIQNLLSYPPKVILLRNADLNVQKIATLLKAKQSHIEAFMADNGLGVLVLNGK